MIVYWPNRENGLLIRPVIVRPGVRLALELAADMRSRTRHNMHLLGRWHSFGRWQKTGNEESCLFTSAFFEIGALSDAYIGCFESNVGQAWRGVWPFAPTVG